MAAASLYQPESVSPSNKPDMMGLMRISEQVHPVAISQAEPEDCHRGPPFGRHGGSRACMSFFSVYLSGVLFIPDMGFEGSVRAG